LKYQTQIPQGVKNEENRCEDRKDVCDLRGNIGVITHFTSLDSLFQKPKLLAQKTQTVQPQVAFEDTPFKLGFEVVKL
jgi:hypothetical protein